jgi:hypothetical protein
MKTECPCKKENFDSWGEIVMSIFEDEFKVLNSHDSKFEVLNSHDSKVLYHEKYTDFKK